MDSSSVYSGLGGLFGGFQNGLQMLLALQKADEDRKIRQGELDVNKGQLNLDTQKYNDTEADKPYVDIQNQHNKSNIMASQADIRREETPPPIGDTYQPTNRFEPPKFGTGPKPGQPGFDPGFNPPQRPGILDGSGLDPGFGAPKRPSVLDGSGIDPGFDPRRRELPSLDTSHIAQVLQRANRTSNFQRSQDVLGGVLNAASQTAQTTQQPQAGRFTTPQGDQAELPTGYSAQPDKTFSPWQMSRSSGRMLWPQIQQEAERRYKDARGAYDRDHVMGMSVQGNPEAAPDRNTFLRDVINEYVAGGKLSESDASAMSLNAGPDFGNVQGGSSTTTTTTTPPAAPSTPAAPSPSKPGSAQRRGFGNPNYKAPTTAAASRPSVSPAVGGRAAPDSLLLRLDRQFNQDSKKVRDELVRLGYDPDAAATP